jgi:hypothetical protein
VTPVFGDFLMSPPSVPPGLRLRLFSMTALLAPPDVHPWSR